MQDLNMFIKKNESRIGKKNIVYSKKTSRRFKRITVNNNE